MKQVQPRSIVYVCDWLPPDYGAVGQYSELFARQLASEGNKVVLGGLTTGRHGANQEWLGRGSLLTVKVPAKTYEKSSMLRRMLWTVKTNTFLLVALWRHLRQADEVIFTGSPPLLLHWISPLNVILRKKLVYRITDFHPECLMAMAERPSVILRLLYRATVFWRRRIDCFEVLGNDQRLRLSEIGIPDSRIRLKRDPSPVEIKRNTRPLPRPAEFRDKLLLLYSGNWGVAHDVDTFVNAYRRHHREGSGRIVLWLNAVGARANAVETALKREDLPLIRSLPVPLDHLASLLVTPDVHLITLLDPFVGFVLPSKVYGCIASGRPVFYIGSEKSDVHELCLSELGPERYERVAVGDAVGCHEALERLADRIKNAQVASNAASLHQVSAIRAG